MLYIIATPIGNLKDITLRALDILRSVVLIACEDTRHTGILLKEYGIQTPLTSYYQHNQVIKGEYLLKLLREGKNIALVSDAGMPGILDPGYSLIRLAIGNGIPMTVIPGATAFVNALILSGKPAHSFIFEGFLPKGSVSRKNRLFVLKNLDRTVIFYESSHRILKTLADIQAVFGEREVVCVRELTKKFEEVRRGPARDIAAYFQSHKPRGEFVVIV
ncbi:MAG: 16S rRNA (cytidine(1402)-2'-O)-methyltransferase [Candidatus Omnitrophica bacterium]|nr:16S rRNA (cytidine(1402)-2'-O)-methyltransferase [Candidatus Omnitrophota bacterium]